MKLEDVAAGVFNILEGTNQGFFGAFAKVKNGKVSLLYENRGSVEPFLDIDVTKRRVYFYTSPKSQLAEKACRKLVRDLQKENFRIDGISFIDKPRLKPNEISLY